MASLRMHMDPAQTATASSGDSHSQTLLDVLVRDGALTADQVQKIKLEDVSGGAGLEGAIRNSGLVSPKQLAVAKASFYNVPFVDLSEKAVSPEALNALPKVVAQRYRVLPFDIDKSKNELSVAMADVLDLGALEFVEKKTGMVVRPFASVPEDIDGAIEEKYSQSLSAEVTAALKETSVDVKTVDISQLGQIIREAPIAKIVSTLLEFAMRSKASDIHIEPQETKTRVRYRIDGILHEKLVLPRKVHDALVSRIKILSGMKIDEKRIPQDGRFNFRAGEFEVDLRVSSLPTTHGEKIVMRLLKKSGGVPSLPDLGLRGLALKNLEEGILRPHGIITVCGPTGSGKTTTLYAVLSKINTTRVNIVTLEDPVEYEIPGVNQVQINPQAGLTFASGLRSFLRQDPNIILVGEIRDSETADLAVQASLTGHLVFSTLHTNDAAGALPRLLDMGEEPFLLASSMTAIVAQRIVRRICEHCKKQYEVPAEVVAEIRLVLGKLLSETTKVNLYKGAGCQTCNDTGYSGRIGVFEVIRVSEKVSKLILERATAGDIAKEAVAEGMIPMKQDGYLKAIEGITTIEEVLRVAQD